MDAQPRFNPAHKRVLDELLLGDDRVRAGKMFGYPAYYAGGKLAICLCERGVGLKLPEESVSALLETDPNAVPFTPMGRRTMREWVEIDLLDSEGYRRYAQLFMESVAFVSLPRDG